MSKLPPPLGVPNDAQRRCDCLLAVGDNGEDLCGAPATVHIIYWWDPDPWQGPGYDHGFACDKHWAEYQQRWSAAQHHDVNPACGMPGSRLSADQPCWFEELDVAEPVRAVAVASTREER